MKIAVTGASGYIGRRVVESLLAHGHEVTAVIRNKNTSDFLAKSNIVETDIFSLETHDYEKILGDSDCLIHLAWESGFNHDDPSHINNVLKHFDFLKGVYEYANVGQLCIAGTVHEVGYHVGAVDANTPCNPKNPYGIAKNFLRNAMFDFASKKEGLILQWLRFYYILGDDEYNNSIFSKILLAENEGRKKFPLNSGQMLYDFIDIHELAEQIRGCMEEKKSGILNCCSGKPMSLKSRVERFINQKNLKIQPEYNVFPERPYDSIAIWGVK